MPMNPRLLRPRRRVTVPGAPTITGADGYTGMLTWSAPASNGGSIITKYRIHEGGFSLTR